MHPMLNIAVRAARNAGDIVVRHLNRIDHLTIASKERNDFVSEADRQAEAEIIAVIRKAYPGHGVLAEESGSQRGDNDEFQPRRSSQHYRSPAIARSSLQPVPEDAL